MATKLNSAQKGQLSDQLAEVYRVASNGTRDFAKVRKALQYIIEGNFPAERLELMDDPHWPYAPTSWYVSPEEQLRKVELLNYKESWGFQATDIPWGIPYFKPRTETEVLMLNLSLPAVDPQPGMHPDNRMPGFGRTFLTLWSLIKEPVKQDAQEIAATALTRLALPPRYGWKPGFHWVAFDPAAYRGFSSARALRQAETDGVRVAGTEVLMAMVLFPNWFSSWDDNLLYPKLSGIQFDYLGGGGYEHTPYLERQLTPPEVILDVSVDSAFHGHFCSPTVRYL